MIPVVNCFATPKTISQAEVLWFDPYQNGSYLPTSWKLSYLEKGGTWKAVETKDSYGVAAGKFNRVTFKQVETTAIRMTAQLPEGETAGVYEFRVSDGKSDVE